MRKWEVVYNKKLKATLVKEGFTSKEDVILKLTVKEKLFGGFKYRFSAVKAKSGDWVNSSLSQSVASVDELREIVDYYNLTY